MSRYRRLRDADLVDVNDPIALLRQRFYLIAFFDCLFLHLGILLLVDQLGLSYLLAPDTCLSIYLLQVISRHLCSRVFVFESGAPLCHRLAYASRQRGRTSQVFELRICELLLNIGRLDQLSSP